MDGERPEKPKAPADLSAPGLIYRHRRNRWAMYWSPRSDIMKRGYQGKTVRLWPSDRTPPQQSEPSRAEWEVISAWCIRYHAEQLLWARGGAEDPLSVFDGTIIGLLNVYQTHKKSPIKKLRYDSLKQYAGCLASLNAAIGRVRVKHITFDDISDWQDEFADNGDGGKPMKARSANMIGALKRAFTFGALVLPKDAGCHDVRDIFLTMAEAKLMNTGSRQRKEYMTAAQCRMIRAKAHELGFHSIAIEQAFAFELGVRQKDVIGEWLPVAWPGVTDIHEGPRKWLMGMRWDEIDENLVLKHRLSKSLRGKSALMDSEAGKVKAWGLRDYPMIMDELRQIAGADQFSRSDLPARGPLIVSEKSGQPWDRSVFKDRWRKIATAAGVPANIQNRDSRSGAATEADLAGVAPDKRQRMLGHARGETTRRYEREELEVSREVAKLRVEKRKP